jgi:hypothetical protein
MRWGPRSPSLIFQFRSRHRVRDAPTRYAQICTTQLSPKVKHKRLGRDSLSFPLSELFDPKRFGGVELEIRLR